MAYSQEDGSEFLQSGKFTSLTEAGLLVGNSYYESKTPFILHSSLNYAFIRNLSAGVGVGVEFYEETYLPVTANVTYRFGSKRIVPFATFQAGYQVALENKKETYYLYDYYPGYGGSSYTNIIHAEGGWMFNPSVGIIICLTNDFGITLSAGYRHQMLKHTWESKQEAYYRYESREREYNRLSLKFGIIF
ncbi:hypothetical protein FACS189435_0350 [Bacteroidia bacterium]|nr:hypothetical protein FACS189435_0350 [Bacteroidia bacterium]